MKQHLRIMSFYGNSENAIETQIWIAVGVYVLVAIARKTLSIEANLYTFLQVLGITILGKDPHFAGVSAHASQLDQRLAANQLNLFDS